MSLFRRTHPYGYYISYDQKRAYPFSRDYTSLGCPKGVWCTPPEDATKDPIREALLRLPLLKDLVPVVLEWYGNREGDSVSYTGSNFPWKKLLSGGSISRVYLYDDSCKPWDKHSHYVSYVDRKALFEQSFQVVPWGPTEIDVEGFECGGQIHYRCPLCWTNYKKNGEPYKTADHAFHHHGRAGFSHSVPTSREVHCDKGVCGMISSARITVVIVHPPKCKCHLKLKSPGMYSGYCLH